MIRQSIAAAKKNISAAILIALVVILVLQMTILPSALDGVTSIIIFVLGYLSAKLRSGR